MVFQKMCTYGRTPLLVVIGAFILWQLMYEDMRANEKDVSALQAKFNIFWLGSIFCPSGNPAKEIYRLSCHIPVTHVITSEMQCNAENASVNRM